MHFWKFYWSEIFIFTLCGAFKAFIKPFDVPQRSVKIKINLIFSLRPILGREGLKAKGLFYS